MIEITQEMFDAAAQEVARRGGYLHPHFNLDYLDEQTRQIIGFLGGVCLLGTSGYRLAR